VRVLVTGNAGFIGFHTARRLLERGGAVVGFDVVNDYYDYDPVLKEAPGREAIKELLPLRAEDVPDTYADVTELERQVGRKPTTPVEEGVARFVAWYREYFHL
jgi:nucleoside-diphosphate-sugar epimerase